MFDKRNKIINNLFKQEFELLLKRNGHKQKSDEEIIKVEGGMPQIISKEVFEEAQLMMNKRKKVPASHKAKTQYLLTGIIKCG